MTDANSVTTKMLLMRNPWGTSDYSAAWHKDDSAWTDDLVAQVPWGIDPRTSTSDGIFTVPMSEFHNCVSNYEIAHHRASEGYSGDWYDAIDMDEQVNNYRITVPANDGALYFTVETYYYNMIPNECTTETITFNQGQSSLTYSSPFLDLQVWKQGENSYFGEYFDMDQFSHPILLTSYNANDSFTLKVRYLWMGSPAKDYTVRIYSKQKLEVLDSHGKTNMLHMDGQLPTGFTNSSYRGMPTPVEEEEIVVEALSDLFAIANAEGKFNLFALIGACFQYPAVCFNPFNWF